MTWLPLRTSILTTACVGALFLSSCATPESSRRGNVPTQHSPEAVQPARLTSPAGPVRRLQIRELVIPQTDLSRYPELAEARAKASVSSSLIYLEKHIDSNSRICLIGSCNAWAKRGNVIPKGSKWSVHQVIKTSQRRCNYRSKSSISPPVNPYPVWLRLNRHPPVVVASAPKCGSNCPVVNSCPARPIRWHPKGAMCIRIT